MTSLFIYLFTYLFIYLSIYIFIFIYLSIYLFIHSFIHLFATSIALGQVKQILKHKSNVPSQTVIQDLHKFN
jgi:hypothetical protein